MKSSNWKFDTRVTKGEKEVSKLRADLFFRLKQGEFIAFGGRQGSTDTVPQTLNH